MRYTVATTAAHQHPVEFRLFAPGYVRRRLQALGFQTSHRRLPYDARAPRWVPDVLGGHDAFLASRPP
ncbi:MAG: hypothetical protein AAF184_11645 [Pseudomonadota bacterium]